MGTFAGRVPPQGAEKKAIFEAIKQEYYESKEWARQQNSFVWKEKIWNSMSVQYDFTVQLCWKTMKEIFTETSPDNFEQKKAMAKLAWRKIVRDNFQLMDV